MPALLDKEPRVRVAVSMRRSQHEALRSAADAERHGNVSLIVQRAIDKELGLGNKIEVERESSELAMAS